MVAVLAGASRELLVADPADRLGELQLDRPATVLARTLKILPLDLGGLIDGGRLQQFGGPLNALHLNLLDRLKF